MEKKYKNCAKKSTNGGFVDLENYQDYSSEVETMCPVVDVTVEYSENSMFSYKDDFAVYSDNNRGYREIPFLNITSPMENNNYNDESNVKINKENFDRISAYVKDGETAYNIGAYYFNKKFYRIAFLLFIIGDHLGNKKCTTNCGYLYCEGLGVKKNNILGMMFYIKGANLGDKLAVENIINILWTFTEEEKKKCIPMLETLKNKKVYLSLGRVLENMGDNEKAIHYYKKGFKI